MENELRLSSQDIKNLIDAVDLWANEPERFGLGDMMMDMFTTKIAEDDVGKAVLATAKEESQAKKKVEGDSRKRRAIKLKYKLTLLLDEVELAEMAISTSLTTG